METTEHLHIFVNRRRFGHAEGVRARMNGGQIAALVHVPPGNAVVRRETPPHVGEVGIDEEIVIHDGEHFLVTRRVVEGG